MNDMLLQMQRTFDQAFAAPAGVVRDGLEPYSTEASTLAALQTHAVEETGAPYPAAEIIRLHTGWFTHTDHARKCACCNAGFYDCELDGDDHCEECHADVEGERRLDAAHNRTLRHPGA